MVLEAVNHVKSYDGKNWLYGFCVWEFVLFYAYMSVEWGIAPGNAKCLVWWFVTLDITCVNMKRKAWYTSV